MRSSFRALICIAILACAATSAADDQWLLPASDGPSLAPMPLASTVSSPTAVLGYPLGSRFTRHADAVAYMVRLAAESERVTSWEYGRTYESRPLTLTAISSPSNIARLESFRGRHLGEIDPASAEDAEDRAPLVVWLSFGVHGNEASSTETALAIAYVLAATEDEDWTRRLEDAVVLIDPLANPDGRERYVSFYDARSGRLPDPYADASEHQESWPGGRHNHYLIDLNRDWAWLTQRETQARMAEYRRWEPHVFVDFHEMSARSTYFFPPAAEPIHQAISSSTVDWLETFGRANARAFDQRGWAYYVGEDFDLFYPGYGDTYPSLRGAVGMTYEMAGHGGAGLAVDLIDGSRLTLADRIARHLLTGLTTIRTAVDNAERLRTDFAARRRPTSKGDGRTYIWDGAQPEARAAALLLRDHGLEPRRLGKSQTLRARSLAGEKDESVTFSPGSWYVSTAHSLAPLLESLMEPRSPMPASYIEEQRRRLEQNRATDFFDITAWSIPTAFGLEVFSTSSKVDRTVFDQSTDGLFGSGDFGYLVAPQGLAGYRLVSDLLFSGVRLRLALAGFTQDGVDYQPGTIFVPAHANPAGLDQTLVRLAAASGARVERTSSARTEAGVSLGSNAVVAVRPPRIGLLEGPGVSPTSLGFLWHLLDVDLETPHHRLNVATLPKVRLSDFDVLVMPSGDYSESWDQKTAERIAQWVESGGLLLAVGEAVTWLQEHELTTVESWKPQEQGESDNGHASLTPERREIDTPGAALATLVSRRPLTVGLPRPPPVLFRGRAVLLATGDPSRDLVVADREQPVLAGFAWPEARERLRGALLVGVEQRGRGGVVVFAQDPVFRLFWRATAPPLLNALLYGPGLVDGNRLRE